MARYESLNELLLCCESWFLNLLNEDYDKCIIQIGKNKGNMLKIM